MNIEHEIDPVTLQRTGRWRRRQFYAQPGPGGLAGRDKRLPSERVACEWRDPPRGWVPA